MCVWVCVQRYIEMCEELESKRRSDGVTIEGMLGDYNHLVAEAQAQEERQSKRIRVCIRLSIPLYDQTRCR